MIIAGFLWTVDYPNLNKDFNGLNKLDMVKSHDVLIIGIVRGTISLLPKKIKKKCISARTVSKMYLYVATSYNNFSPDRSLVLSIYIRVLKSVIPYISLTLLKQSSV